MYKCILCNSDKELQYDEYSKLYSCSECHHCFDKEELEQDRKNIVHTFASIVLDILLLIPILGLFVYLCIEQSQINHKQKYKFTELYLAVLVTQFVFILLNLVWYKAYKSDLVMYTMDRLRYVATKTYMTDNHLPSVSIPVLDDLIEKAKPIKEVETKQDDTVPSDTIHNDLLDYSKYWYLDDATVSGTRVLELLDSLSQTQCVYLVQTGDVRVQRGEDVFRNYGIRVASSELAVSRFGIYYTPRQNTYDIFTNEEGTLEYISLNNISSKYTVGTIRSAFTYRVNLIYNSVGEVIGFMFTEVE